MGLLGIAMSRYSGCWVGMKVIADTVETTATVDLKGEDRVFNTPTDFEMPEDGLNIRWPDDRWQQDHRLQTHKGYAAIAFGRANHVDKVVIDTPKARFGIISSGKAYEDTREALRQLGIGEAEAAAIGLRVYKVGMPWPLEPEGVRHFAEGLEEVLVIEERREIIEFQIKQQLSTGALMCAPASSASSITRTNRTCPSMWNSPPAKSPAPLRTGSCISSSTRPCMIASKKNWRGLKAALKSDARIRPLSFDSRISVRGVRTTPRPMFLRARALARASAVTSW